MQKTLLIVLLTIPFLMFGCPSGGDDDDDTTPAEIEGDEAGECDDGVDNDQDGLTDCDDDGCENATDCTGDDDDSTSSLCEGPYIEIKPAVFDFGDVERDSLISGHQVQIRNVAQCKWEMIFVEQIPAGIFFDCIDGAEYDCVNMDPDDQHTWDLEVRTYCGDGGSAQFDFVLENRELGDSYGQVLDQAQLSLVWNTTGC